MNKQKLPLVSVIMPVHNAGKFLGPAIESILAQTYPKIEFLIVDDASVDDSWKTIRTYKRRFPNKIKIFHIDKQTNAAGNGAVNFGLTHAKGTLIARMDADDITLPKRIEKQVAYMLGHADTILVGTQATIIDGGGKTTGKKLVPTEHEAIYEQFGILHPLIHPSVMIRRSLLPNPEKIYSMKWDINDDYYAFFQLLQYGRFANLPDVLLKYRIHGNNVSLLSPKQKFYCSVQIRIEAIKRFGYRMSLTALALMFIQITLVSLLPEQAIVPLYMFLRGMWVPKRILAKVKRLTRLTRLPAPISVAAGR